MLKVAFFTEAGSKRGFGHLIRSYTIFEEFKHFDATFFLDSDINFDDKFQNLHYFSWSKFTIDTKYDIVLIDSYKADLEIYKRVHKHTKVLISIDDFKRLEYPQGLIINFAPDAEKLYYSTKKYNYKYLLGLNYIPIRKAFKELEVKKKEQLFIMLGGTDIKNLTLDIVKNLQEINLNIVVVHNDLKTVEQLKQMKQITVLYKPKDIMLIKTMKESSFAITTASMSAYELSYLKTPTLIVEVAENQKNGSEQLLKHKVITYILDKPTEAKLYIEKMRTNKCKFTDKIDGLGAKRIYKEVMELL